MHGLHHHNQFFVPGPSAPPACVLVPQSGTEERKGEQNLLGVLHLALVPLLTRRSMTSPSHHLPAAPPRRLRPRLSSAAVSTGCSSPPPLVRALRRGWHPEPGQPPALLPRHRPSPCRRRRPTPLTRGAPPSETPPAARPSATSARCPWPTLHRVSPRDSSRCLLRALPLRQHHAKPRQHPLLPRASFRHHPASKTSTRSVSDCLAEPVRKHAARFCAGGLRTRTMSKHSRPCSWRHRRRATPRPGRFARPARPPAAPPPLPPRPPPLVSPAVPEVDGGSPPGSSRRLRGTPLAWGRRADASNGEKV